MVTQIHTNSSLLYPLNRHILVLCCKLDFIDMFMLNIHTLHIMMLHCEQVITQHIQYIKGQRYKYPYIKQQNRNGR